MTARNSTQFTDRHNAMIGRRFGRLVVQRWYVADAEHWRVYAVCNCDCGGAKAIRLKSLVCGATQSCGCLFRDRVTKHGMSRSPEYRVWATMRNRCNDPTATEYERYGGKGIAVCDRWDRSFQAFIDDMGRRPTPRHQIDRIDGDKGYEPGNCRWATPRENTNNQAVTKHVTVDGVTKPLSVIAEEYGIAYDTLYRRVVTRGWDLRRALTQPVHFKPRHKQQRSDAC
jgi:hypothetical protein